MLSIDTLAKQDSLPLKCIGLVAKRTHGPLYAFLAFLIAGILCIAGAYPVSQWAQGLLLNLGVGLLFSGAVAGPFLRWLKVREAP